MGASEPVIPDSMAVQEENMTEAIPLGTFMFVDATATIAQVDAETWKEMLEQVGKNTGEQLEEDMQEETTTFVKNTSTAVEMPSPISICQANTPAAEEYTTVAAQVYGFAEATDTFAQVEG